MFHSFDKVLFMKVKFKTMKDSFYFCEFVITKRVDGHCEFMITVNLNSQWYSCVVIIFVFRYVQTKKLSNVGRNFFNNQR